MSPTTHAACAAPAHSNLLAATTLVLTCMLGSPLLAQPFLPDGAMPVPPTQPGVVDSGLAYVHGDLNGDGWLDVVVAYGDGNWPPATCFLATWMGNGAGFDPPTIYADPDCEYTGLALTDVDGDDDLDLVSVGRDVVATVDPGRIAVFLNSGGVLAPPSHLTLPEIPQSVTAADLDGDGHVDLAVVVSVADISRVLTLSNDGDGGFLPASAIDLVGYGLGSGGHVTAGDVDGDGTIDLVVSCRGTRGFSLVNGSLLLLHNDGMGGFDIRPIDKRTDFAGYALAAIEDVDGDGHQDVIAVWSLEDPFILQFVNSRLRLFLGDGAGRFTALPSSLVVEADIPPNPHSIATEDLDGDGDLDVLGLWGPEAIFLENLGGSTFGERLLMHLPLTGGGGLLDYDGDGAPDLVGVTADVTLNWARNNFENRFATFEHHMPLKIPHARGHIAEDMDGDGDTDIVAFVGGPTSELRVFANDGTGALTPLSATPSTGGSPQLDDVQAADVDGDGDTDIVVGGGGVYLNDGAGQLLLVGPPLPAPSSEAFTLADLDEDGFLEMIVRGGMSWQPGGLSLHRQTSPGVFELAGTWGADEFTVGDFQVGDNDGDGHVDVVFGFTTPADVPGFGVLAGDGLGGLVEPAQLHAFAPGDTVRDVVVTDLDVDGLADVALTGTLDGVHHLSIYLGQAGSPLPLLAQDIVTESSLRIETIADLDVDGTPDLLGVLELGWWDPTEVVTIWINDGAGSLTAIESFVSLHGGPVHVADVDGDGSQDLVMADGGSPVMVRRNDGAGHFADATWAWVQRDATPNGSIQPLAMLLAPMDANGSADLVKHDGSDDATTLSVLLSVYDGTPSGTCELDFNGDGVVSQADHYQLAPVVDGIYYATYTYLYRPDLFDLYFPDVDPATLDWNGDGEINLEEVAPNVPFSTDSYYWQWQVYVLRDWIIENYGIDYYAEWWPDSGCN